MSIKRGNMISSLADHCLSRSIGVGDLGHDACSCRCRLMVSKENVSRWIEHFCWSMNPATPHTRISKNSNNYRLDEICFNTSRFQDVLVRQKRHNRLLSEFDSKKKSLKNSKIKSYPATKTACLFFDNTCSNNLSKSVVSSNVLRT